MSNTSPLPVVFTPSDASEPARRRGVHEWSAIFLLLFGGFVFGIGWIAGLILLWSSKAWRTSDKLLGTFVVPGGLTGVLYVSLFAFGSSSSEACWPNTSANVRLTAHASLVRHGHVVCAVRSGSGTNIFAIVGIVAALLLPIVTAIHLARSASRSQTVPA